MLELIFVIAHPKRILIQTSNYAFENDESEFFQTGVGLYLHKNCNELAWWLSDSAEHTF